MNSWSHVTNYPPLILSGVYDLIHHYSSSRGRKHDSPCAEGAESTKHHPQILPLLPCPLPHALLSLAFGISSFLMLAHAKADALDSLMHRLLGLCMAVVGMTVMTDGIWGQSDSCAVNSGSSSIVCHSSDGKQLLLKLAKALALMMEGCWFLAIAHIMFSDDLMWQGDSMTDMTRVMFVPVLFIWTFLGGWHWDGAGM
jgi:hypothetical protein